MVQLHYGRSSCLLPSVHRGRGKMGVFGTLAAIGMAVGPPLIYADQAYSIVKKRDSSGFSHDVCGVVIIANIIRVFFWLGNRFETPLLIQSLLLILSQLLLLALCLHYAPHIQQDADFAGEQVYAVVPTPRATRIKNLLKNRPGNFWQWEGYGSYLEFLAGLIVCLGILQVIFGRWLWYIDALGFIALSIESTLPIPQFISNYRRKTCYGFRESTLAGWFGGDLFKTGYFFIRGNPVQFKVTAIMTLCWDSAVLAQRIKYGSAPPAGKDGLALRGEDEELDEQSVLNHAGR